MKKIIISSVCWLVSILAFAQINTFVVKEVGGNILRQEGNPSKRQSPCSTFKIAIALMGYDAGILIDEYHPKWPYKEEYQALLDSWKQPQTPTSWLENSCIWYSQEITRKLGMKRFKDYIKRFSYGNQNVSGDKGKNNGLTHAWLESSLQISPEEQVLFIEKLLRSELSLSKKTYDYTREILYVEDLPKGWRLFGKTGTGAGANVNAKGALSGFQTGWFVGWIQKDERYFSFAYHIEDEKEESIFSGLRAKNNAKVKLVELIQGLDI